MLISFVGYVLRTNMSVAGTRMTEELGLSQLQLGWVLARVRLGLRDLSSGPGDSSVIGWAAGEALTLIAVALGRAQSAGGVRPGAPVAGPVMIVITLALLRFLMGAAQAPMFPVLGGHTIARWFPVSGWALPNSLTNAGLTLGAAATGPLIVLLIRAAGWRGSFALTAPLAFLFAGLWWWYGRDEPAQHAAVSAEELAVINADRPPVGRVAE